MISCCICLLLYVECICTVSPCWHLCTCAVCFVCSSFCVYFQISSSNLFCFMSMMQRIHFLVLPFNTSCLCLPLEAVMMKKQAFSSPQEQLSVEPGYYAALINAFHKNEKASISVFFSLQNHINTNILQHCGWSSAVSACLCACHLQGIASSTFPLCFVCMFLCVYI